ncbi:hypothetical protein WA026_002100 [Henosepilachna vigintioctopunctata]|uniref:Peptidase M12B propeptide domain-containing protein n=1 Tax=Henosepilachna vigintioctopunctata TaxID=420089 RepID=A0AAW1TTV3_9CUCU
MLLFVIYLQSFLLGSVHNFVIEALHDHMTESELAYYFQDMQKIELPKYDIVYLPTVEAITEADRFDGTEKEEMIDYTFSAFDQPVSLKLKRNKNLLAPNFKTFIRNGDESVKILPKYTKNCHYLHKDEISVAAISSCQPQSVQGIIIMNNETLEIHPLTQRLQTVLKLREPLLDSVSNFDLDEKVPHLVKRASKIPAGALDDVFLLLEIFGMEN